MTFDSDPLAETQIAQGITTAVQGPDGESPWPIATWVDARKKNPAAINVAVLAGHATIREQVMGKDFKRVASEPEIEKMAQLRKPVLAYGSKLPVAQAYRALCDEIQERWKPADAH